MVILIDLGKVFNKIKHPASTNLTQERRTLTQTRPYVYSITKCLRGFFFSPQKSRTPGYSFLSLLSTKDPKRIS